MVASGEILKWCNSKSKTCTTFKNATTDFKIIFFLNMGSFILHTSYSHLVIIIPLHINNNIYLYNHNATKYVLFIYI